MKLISEVNDFNDFELEVLAETAGGKKSLYITGPFMMFDKQNRNGRVYSEQVLTKAVNAYTKTHINERRALGELNHPPTPQVDPERAAVMTTKLWKDGNHYMGKAKVLSTPMGKIVEALIQDGWKAGVSSRGIGTIKKSSSGINEVQSDFMLTAAIDVVSDPSAQDAFVEGIYESVDYMIRDGVIAEAPAEALRETIKTASRKDIEAAKLSAWANLMEDLVKK